jgi:hypothetical protein
MAQNKENDRLARMARGEIGMPADANFGMKYGDTESPGTFRADAPVTKFSEGPTPVIGFVPMVTEMAALDKIAGGTSVEGATKALKATSSSGATRPSWLGQKSQPGIPGGGDTRHSTPAPKPPVTQTPMAYGMVGGKLTQTGGTQRPSWMKPLHKYTPQESEKLVAAHPTVGSPAWMKKKKGAK